MSAEERKAIFRTNDGSVVIEHGGEAFSLPEPPENNVAQPMMSAMSVFEKMRHLRRSLKVWQAAGRPLASKTARTARLAACNACPFWNAQGNFWLGECRAPGCGCTRGKAWLATERCPHPEGSRWPVTY